MLVDDNWCADALRVLPEGNYLITSLNKRYSYNELEQYDFIASCTTGCDHIENRGIPLISLKGETDFLMDVHATSEHVFALILSLIRRIPFAFDDVKQGNWNRDAWQGTELHGKTLGIVGFGRVGQQVAKLAEGFGMNAIRHDKRDVWDCEYYLLTTKLFEGTLEKSDIITIHVPLTDDTKNLFSYKALCSMKRNAFLINTSRGGVVDEEALLWALENGRIAGAALDVMQNEPDVNHDLLHYAAEHDNLVLTPHLGGNTTESRIKTQLHMANKIREYVGGG